MALPRVPTTSDSRARRTSPIAPHAAGGRAFTTVPSGAVTNSGRIAPALIGPCGSNNALDMVNTAVVDVAGPRLVGPATCGAQPLKSAARVSSSTVRRSLSGSGSGLSPVLSRQVSYS